MPDCICPNIEQHVFAEMVHHYGRFVLCWSILLSPYWKEACAIHDDNKVFDTWNKCLFALIMKEYNNRVLSGEHTVTVGDVFCNYLHRGLKKPNDMSLKAIQNMLWGPFQIVQRPQGRLWVDFWQKGMQLVFLMPFLPNIATCLFNNKKISQYGNGWFCWLLPDLSLHGPAPMQIRQMGGCWNKTK